MAPQAELGDTVVAATVELSDDPALASFQASAVAPLGPADQQVLLEAPSIGRRLRVLDQLLTEREFDLRQQIELDT